MLINAINEKFQAKVQGKTQGIAAVANYYHLFVLEQYDITNANGNDNAMAWGRGTIALRTTEDCVPCVQGSN